MYEYEYDQYKFEDVSYDKCRNTKRVSIDKMDASSYDTMNPKHSLLSQLFRLQFANTTRTQTCDKSRIVFSDCFVAVSCFAHFLRKQPERSRFRVSCLFR